MKNNSSNIDKELHQFLLDNYLVVTTVNKNYLKIFDIWYYFFRESNYQSILRVITLDKKSDTYIKKKGIKTIHPGKNSESFSKIIQWRFEEIYKLLQQGKNIIQCDADAIWINPKLDLIINDKFDIQSSIGYGIPVNAVNQWGFSLCTGFMILQSNENVISFMKKWIGKCKIVQDDQIAFNNLLLENSIHWDTGNITGNQGYSKVFNLKIDAMSFFLVSRSFTREVLIYHPYLKSNHQLLKLMSLVNKLSEVVYAQVFLKHHFYKEIYNPINWIMTTHGFFKVMFYKLQKRLTTNAI